MKLSEKGHFAPPPALRGPAESLSQALAQWPKVHARTHWYLGDENEIDGADFYVGDEELGHLHLDGQAHIFQAPEVAKALVKAKLARPFRWQRHMVVMDVETQKDVEHARWLFELNYDHLRNVPTATLLERVKRRAS